MQDLERILEEYLIKDLLALKETRVGYPILMTVFAGVELLGSLLQDGENGTDGDDFRHYWTQYLYPSATRPKTEREAGIIYELVRHGVMHHFFPRGRVGITGTDPGGHLTCREDGVLIIDTHVLIDDYVRVYWRRVAPLLQTPSGSPSRATMQKRLDDIRAVGARKMPVLHSVFEVPSAALGTQSATTAKSSSAQQALPGGPSGPS